MLRIIFMLMFYQALLNLIKSYNYNTKYNQINSFWKQHPNFGLQKIIFAGLSMCSS